MTRTLLKPVIEGLLRHLSPDEQAIPGQDLFGNSRIEEALKYLNGGMQEIRKSGSEWPAMKSFGAAVNAPTDITNCVITAGETTFTNPSDWEDWMMGCTCTIPGESGENQIMGYDPLADIVSLKIPVLADYSGAITVYHDSIAIDAECYRVSRPVVMTGVGELVPVTDEAPSLYSLSSFGRDQDYGTAWVFTSPRNFPSDKTASNAPPGMYYMETEFSYGWAYRLRMRITPAPRAATTIRYKGMLKDKHTLAEILLAPDGPGYLTVSSTVAAELIVPLDTIPLTDPTTVSLVDMDGQWPIASFNVTSVDRTTGSLVLTHADAVPVGTYAPMFSFDKTAVYPATLRFPDDLIESALIPYAEQRMTASPYFRNREAKPEIFRQFEAAQALVSASQPQVGSLEIHP